ncbi:MAG: hypothetical protein KAR35_09810 [Candidatus Heimdallarchaeota archaeon]|nr:hypothetical protein [Candidatus Heimdallarchaeota archaeon]MCK5049652.1 hypothetical protein [Candidatus Heimdallarchaeota archaeon]
MYISSICLDRKKISEENFKQIITALSEGGEFEIQRNMSQKRSFSGDDVILTSFGANEGFKTISNILGIPLYVRFEVEDTSLIIPRLEEFAAYVIEAEYNIYLGVSLIPLNTLKEIFSFPNSDTFMKRLLGSSFATDMQPLLAVKPKGFIRVSANHIEFDLPRQKADTLHTWIGNLISGEINLETLKGIYERFDFSNKKRLDDIDKLKEFYTKEFFEKVEETEIPEITQICERAFKATGII